MISATWMPMKMPMKKRCKRPQTCWRWKSWSSCGWVGSVGIVVVALRPGTRTKQAKPPMLLKHCPWKPHKSQKSRYRTETAPWPRSCIQWRTQRGRWPSTRSSRVGKKIGGRTVLASSSCTRCRYGSAGYDGVEQGCVVGSSVAVVAVGDSQPLWTRSQTSWCCSGCPCWVGP